MGKILGFARITKKGQITIPKKVRDHLQVEDGDNRILLLENEKLIIESGDKEIKT